MLGIPSSFQHCRAVAFRSAAVTLAVLWMGAGSARAATSFNAEQLEFFERKVRPILAESCYPCHSHSGEKLKANLYLDTRADALKGGDTGPAILEGHPEKSLLIEAISYNNADLKMPPKTRLSGDQVRDLTEWVRQGAPWPDEQLKIADRHGFDLQKRKGEHWCWQPLAPHAPPEVKHPDWPITGSDRFILAQLEKSGLSPAPAADQEALLRRLTFDLTGLPPAPSEVDAFLQDTSATAWESTVERLLASPRFGERWARHWLDLVRYAETRGHEFDPPIPNAWEYRDYVIRALNQDVPYDLFVREHLAGDLIPPRLDPITGANESILGTGFWFLGEEVHSPVDIRQDETDRLDNRLDVMGKSFLGLTVGCARCHDHKFDAISQRDYYALTGFLASSGYRQARFESLEVHRRLASELEAMQQDLGPHLLHAVTRAQAAQISCVSKWIADARSLEESPAPLGEPILETDNALPTLAWLRELRLARQDGGHPLHSVVAGVPARSPKAASTSSTPPVSVIDYACAPPALWLQDGFTFGLHPVEMGQPLPGLGPDQPLLGLATRPAAWRQPFWNRLKVTGVERDAGRLGEWERSEQTIRSPEFRLARKKLWYLVRGAGRAYANVDSHLMIVGPLHQGLLHEWRSPPDRWTWVEHGLADYLNHRLHVEFSPVGSEPLAIAQVVQSDEAPPLPTLESPSPSPDSGTGPGSLEHRLAEVFQEVAQSLQTGKTSAWSSAQWETADWMVRNLDLFCPPGSSRRQELASEIAPWMAAQSDLAAQIRPHSATAPAMFEGNGIDEFVLIRGASRHPGELAPRRFLEALAGANSPTIRTGSGRLELARQITDPSNPLTSRVIVNRVWHHLFGRGLVATVDNFGVLGERPSHPELLDYLADRFVHEQGWSIKKLIREIVLSRAYQMSSRPSDLAAEQLDPQNVWLHRMNVRRLEGEAIRDALLAVSGRLDLLAGGPSVPVHLTPFMEGRGRPGQSGPLDGDGRRSIYQAIRRNFLNPMMLAFDSPIPFNAMGRRNVSNVPAQALMMMNDPFVVEQATRWAHQLPPQADVPCRIRSMYLAAFARNPTSDEMASATQFLAAQTEAYGIKSTDDPRVWADLGHVLFNVKEFIYLN